MNPTPLAVAVIGPGAVGGTVAAELARARHVDLVVCARTPVDEIVVEAPHGSFSIHPRLISDPSQATVVSWILVATKAYDAKNVKPWLAALATKETRVAILQNGVEHEERFSPYAGAASIVPVVVECSAERKSATHIHLRQPARLVVERNENGRDFAQLFANTKIDVQLAADFKTAMWQKLCLNSVGAVSALAGHAVSTSDPAVEAQMRAILRECVAVGRCEGACLDDLLIESIVDRYKLGTPVNSMLADRLRGRPLEYDARNGAIVRLAKKHGIATPSNDAMVRSLAALSH